jgi:hypothetical protein
MTLDEIVKECEKQVDWKNFRNYIHSFSGNFDHYKKVVTSLEKKDITKFIKICDNRKERARVLLSDVATVLGFLMAAISILVSFSKDYRIIFLGAIIIILGFALLNHYRANVHAWTAFKEAAILKEEYI